MLSAALIRLRLSMADDGSQLFRTLVAPLLNEATNGRPPKRRRAAEAAEAAVAQILCACFPGPVRAVPKRMNNTSLFIIVMRFVIF